MFEKEAENYADKQIGCGDGYYEWTDVEQAFKEGAEFGYNKAFVEADKNLKAVVADYNKAKAEIKLLKETHRQSLKILTDQIEELHKANEWHYVKDGLPKEFDKPYLCKVNSHFEVGYFMAYKEQPWHFDNYYLDNEDVDAWKEIVLPEVKESE